MSYPGVPEWQNHWNKGLSAGLLEGEAGQVSEGGADVTQADRAAAAAFYGSHLARPGEVPVTAHMLAGKIDESPLIQAFARHRLTPQADIGKDAGERAPAMIEVEADVHALMIDASRRAGQKVNDWISGRMREAASRAALSPSPVKDAVTTDLLAALKALRLQALQSTVNDPANEWGQEALAMASAAIAKASPPSEQFPQPQRRDGKEPCGECHLKPGETCDICGARAEATYAGIPMSELARSGVLGWHPGDEA